MNIQDLINLASNKLAILNNARSTALTLGDPDQLNRLDAEIQEVETTLEKLRSAQ